MDDPKVEIPSKAQQFLRRMHVKVYLIFFQQLLYDHAVYKQQLATCINNLNQIHAIG